MTTRTKVRLIAIVFSLLYTGVRVWLVNATLAGYGVNPWVFLVIDAVTGVLYVLGIEQLVYAMMPKHDVPMRKVAAWSIVALVSFALPYLYLFISSRELPATIGVGLVVIILLLLANAILTLRRQLRRKQGR